MVSFTPLAPCKPKELIWGTLRNASRILLLVVLSKWQHVHGTLNYLPGVVYIHGALESCFFKGSFLIITRRLTATIGELPQNLFVSRENIN